MAEPKIIVCADHNDLNIKAAEYCAKTAKQAMFSSGTCTISLSGGSTPKSLYALLATPEWRSRFNWKHIHLFWGDERCVPIDHPDSNFGMVKRELLSKVEIPEENIHRFPVELQDPAAIAQAYDASIRQFFGVAHTKSEVPRFDLVFLGLGENGHTVSLFPHSPVLQEKEKLAVADYIEEMKSYRVTTTVPLINAARHALFLVSGTSKAQVVQEVIEGPRQPEQLPAQLISPVRGTLVWLLDRDAAALTQFARGSNA